MNIRYAYMHAKIYIFHVYVLCAHSNGLVYIYQGTEQHNCMVYYHRQSKTKYIHQAKYSYASQHMHLQLMHCVVVTMLGWIPADK